MLTLFYQLKCYYTITATTIMTKHNIRTELIFVALRKLFSLHKILRKKRDLRNLD